MLTKIEKIDAYSALAIKIIESHEEDAIDFLTFREKLSLANISHPEKKEEWVTARVAIWEALNVLKVRYPGFHKDEHGKSQSMNGCGHMSLSHTMGFASAIYHRKLPVGIDMDVVRDKIIRIGPRFLADSELEFLEKDPLHYTMAWSAKESIFKCEGKRGISFRENIRLQPFNSLDTIIMGQIQGTEFADRDYSVHVRTFDDVVLTYTTW
jgi:phosphopantetheinyl transferase